MNENELIKELMSEYFYEITDKNYLDKYNYLFDSVYGNHDGIADQLKRKKMISNAVILLIKFLTN